MTQSISARIDPMSNAPLSISWWQNLSNTVQRFSSDEVRRAFKIQGVSPAVRQAQRFSDAGRGLPSHRLCLAILKKAASLFQVHGRPNGIDSAQSIRRMWPGLIARNLSKTSPSEKCRVRERSTILSGVDLLSLSPTPECDSCQLACPILSSDECRHAVANVL